MTYMGSKRKYCKYIVPIIQKYIDEHNITVFVDVFCGGANLTDKINCQKVIGNDLSPTLIALHQTAQKDFSKIPTDGSREYWDKAYTEYKKIKSAMDKGEEYQPEIPLFEIGAIEWYASFSNGGFPRGYAKNTQTRNYYQEGWRNHKKQTENPLYRNIDFIQGNYKDILSNFFTLMSFIQNNLKEDSNSIFDIYLKILDSTRCDIPDPLQSYWLDNRERLGLTGKFLPETSKLI